MALTDTKIKALRPLRDSKQKDYSDGNNLYLRIKSTSAKTWVFRYSYLKKPYQIGLGAYPAVSLKQAREEAKKLKEILAQGKDPKLEKLRLDSKDKTFFKNVAEEWFKTKSHGWSQNYQRKVNKRIQEYILPAIGNYQINAIDATVVLGLLRNIESTGKLETMSRVRSYINQIFNYAIATGQCTSNPAASLTGVLKTGKTTNYAHLTKPDEIAAFLNKVDEYGGSFVTKCALKMAPYVFVRPGELVGAQWCEIDFQNKQWRIPEERMKMDTPHIVPLASQVISLLEELKAYTGGCKYLFPHNSSPSKTMSTDTLRLALRRMGYSKDQITTHGLRHMASTRLNEMASEYGWSTDMIERQLAHAERNKVKAAYNHAEYLKDRRKMMQEWADYLCRLKEGKNVVSFEKVGA